MAIQQDAPERARAWVLLKVENPGEVAAQLWTTLKGDSCSNWLVVRADVVSGHDDYNIVVPVDAANDGKLNEAIGRIVEVAGVDPAMELRVEAHNPTHPHMGLSFITEAEAAGDPRIETGLRIPKSPAENPWG